jgi:hypothetical protein
MVSRPVAEAYPLLYPAGRTRANGGNGNAQGLDAAEEDSTPGLTPDSFGVHRRRVKENNFGDLSIGRRSGRHWSEAVNTCNP